MEMQMTGDYILSVVLTGLVVVFIGLILLIIFVWLMGKVFGLINSGKNNNTKPKTVETKVNKVVKSAPTAALEIEKGISDEIVAVISAAIAAMSDSESGFVLKSIKKSSANSSRRSAWGAQGISESTKVF